MTNDRGPGWNRLLMIGSAFGLPLLGMGYAAVVTLTRLDDNMTTLRLNQQEQGIDIKDIKADLNTLKGRVDTIGRRQENNQRDNNYRFMLFEHGIKPAK